jgi:hypothetical protein
MIGWSSSVKAWPGPEPEDKVRAFIERSKYRSCIRQWARACPGSDPGA